jgi:3-methyl-2-oxobutanoate hydroxymethyltransferase
MNHYPEKLTIKKIQHLKKQKPIVCISAYSYPIAKIIDKFCDIILVGDSVAMSIYGMENTLGANLSMMINHTNAVMRARKKSLIVVDMPFGSFEESKEKAFKNAYKIINKTGCDAVKIEASEEMIETIKFLIDRGIPVMSHIGLLPQKVKLSGEYKYQGKDNYNKIINLSKELEKIGSFSLIIEGVYEELAQDITKTLSIPVIGIGASQKCDGQILVIDDIIGLNTEFKPKFVKNYDNIAQNIKNAVEKYEKEVINFEFPQQNHLTKLTK